MHICVQPERQGYREEHEEDDGQEGNEVALCVVVHESREHGPDDAPQSVADLHEADDDAVGAAPEAIPRQGGIARAHGADADAVHQGECIARQDAPAEIGNEDQEREARRHHHGGERHPATAPDDVAHPSASDAAECSDEADGAEDDRRKSRAVSHIDEIEMKLTHDGVVVEPDGEAHQDEAPKAYVVPNDREDLQHALALAAVAYACSRHLLGRARRVAVRPLAHVLGYVAHEQETCGRDDAQHGQAEDHIRVAPAYRRDEPLDQGGQDEDADSDAREGDSRGAASFS